MHVDIIGDIHGCNKSLEALLEKLGYQTNGGSYRHPDRKAIFLGDFIDRGPGQREVLAIVCPMIDSGHALAVMGNHEYNAICYFTRHPETGEFLREHSNKNRGQHQAFLKAFENTPAHADIINWFRTLPLWLDLGNLRIIRACWDKHQIAWLRDTYKIDNCLNDSLLLDSSVKDSEAHLAIETLLKVKEVPLPDGASIKDEDGNPHHHIRIKWWHKQRHKLLDCLHGATRINNAHPGR